MRAIALVVTSVVLIVLALNWAKPVLLPVALAILIHLALAPIVRWLKKLGLPTGLGALLVVIALFGSLGVVVWRLSVPAVEWMERLPQTLSRAEVKLRELRAPMRAVEQASAQVEQIAEQAQGDAVMVEIQEPKLATLVLSGLQSIAVAAFMVAILLYFLLASEGSFLRKLVRIMPRLQDKKRAVEVIRGIEQDVSRYLLNTLLIGLGVGVAESLALYCFGVPNPVLWGAMAAFMNWIPYVGAIAGTAIVGLVGLATFDSTWYALLVAGVFFAITSIEGTVVTPLIHGKGLRLNQVVLFVWLALWTWMWGLIGSLIAVPMLAALRIVCDKIESLAALGEFLSDRVEDSPPAREPATVAATNPEGQPS